MDSPPSNAKVNKGDIKKKKIASPNTLTVSVSSPRTLNTSRQGGFRPRKSWIDNAATLGYGYNRFNETNGSGDHSPRPSKLHTKSKSLSQPLHISSLPNVATRGHSHHGQASGAQIDYDIGSNLPQNRNVTFSVTRSVAKGKEENGNPVRTGENEDLLKVDEVGGGSGYEEESGTGSEMEPGKENQEFLPEEGEGGINREADSVKKKGKFRRRRSRRLSSISYFKTEEPSSKKSKRNIKARQGGEEDKRRSSLSYKYEWAKHELPKMDFVQSPDYLRQLLKSSLEMESFIWLGVVVCFDALLYCFTYWPLLFIKSCWILVRSWFGHTKMYPSYVYCLFKGAIMVITIGALDVMDLYEAYAFVKDLTWTRLYVLFNLFALFDQLLEQLGKRVMGSLVWAISHKSQRLLMLFISAGYILIHSLILNMEVSTVHIAINTGNELLTLLLAVKFVELKVNSDLQDKRDLFKMCLIDVTTRFKWMVFLIITFLDKFSLRYLILYEEVRKQSRLNDGYFGYVKGIVTWSKESLLNHFYTPAPDIHEPLEVPSAATNVQDLPVGGIKSAPGSGHTAGGILAPHEGVVDAFGDYLRTSGGQGGFSTEYLKNLPNATKYLEGMHSWLPAFFSSCGIVLLVEFMIDLIKHCTMTMLTDWLDSSVYASFRVALGVEFESAPLVGLTDSRGNLLSQHFDVVMLPITCVILRLVWIVLVRFHLTKIQTISIFLAVFMCLCLAKLFTRLYLRWYGKRCKKEFYEDDELYEQTTKKEHGVIIEEDSTRSQMPERSNSLDSINRKHSIGSRRSIE
eukprot:Nk52_evm5s332 gene=Nk52_evmTU5s332